MTAPLDDLVVRLYSAVLDPAEWLSAPECLRVELNASAALQHVWRAIDKPDLSLCVNADPAMMQRYRDYYQAMDPWMARLHTIPGQTVALGAWFLPEEDFRATEFCNDFLLPQDFYRFVTAVDEAPPQGISVVSFLRSRNAPDFGQAEQSTLHAFLPHFRHCIRIQRRLMTFASRVHLLEDTLDTLDYGILLLDPTDRVVHCNRRAEQILREQSALVVRQSRLRARDHATEIQLLALLAAANGKDKSLLEQRPGAMAIGTAEGASPIRALIAPFLARIRDDFQSVSTIVFLLINDSNHLDGGELLRQVYAFTPTETRCALLLTQGSSLDDIAVSLGATRNTVRAHLSSLFRKTGTHRQGALVATLNRELAVLAVLAVLTDRASK